MKYEKFEGSLGEFLELHGTDAVKFYRRIPRGYGDLVSYSLKQLILFYNEGEIYIEKEEVWTDHLPLLCWVSDNSDFTGAQIRVVESFGGVLYFCGDKNGYYHARPVTKEEVEKFILDDKKCK